VARTLIVALLIASAACASGGGGGTTVSLQAFGDPAELRAYRGLIAAFEKRSPGLHVRLVSVPNQDDHYAKLGSAMAAGRPPDVFLINFRNFPAFAAGDGIDPTTEDTDAFAPQAVEAFRWRSAQLCVPQNVSSLVVYYNRDAFTDAGLDLPRRGWTFGEFLNAAVRLTTADRHGVATDGSLIRLAPLVWSAGGEVADDDGFRLHEPDARQALQIYMELGRSLATPTEEELEAEHADTRFATGRAAMVLGSRRLTTTFREITGFNWDVADMPRIDRPASILHSDAYCVARVSPRREAAHRFVHFAVSAEGQRILSRTGRIVPARSDVARSDAFLDDLPPASADVFLDAIPTLRRTPRISTWPTIEREADAVLEEAFFEAEPPGAQPTDETGPLLELLEARTRHLFAEAERG
jgi:multiple sugar transport system substrate-binding protein